MPRINHLAVLAAVIADQALGFAWYQTFGKAWLAALGKRLEEVHTSDPTPYLLSLAGAALFTYALAWLIGRTATRGALAGARLGGLVGLAFAASAVVLHEAFLGHPGIVMAIDGGNELAGGLLAGAILGAWPGRGDGEDHPTTPVG